MQFSTDVNFSTFFFHNMYVYIVAESEKVIKKSLLWKLYEKKTEKIVIF